MIFGLLLLLALAGGYFFIRDWEMTSFVSLREDGHRLYFRSAVAGIAILIAFSILIQALQKIFPVSLAHVSGYLGVPPETHVFATASILTLFLGKFLALGINRSMRQLRESRCRFIRWIPCRLNLGRDLEAWREEAIRADDVDSLVFDATTNEFPLLLTVDNGKIYIGYVDSWPKPGSENECLTLLPLASGFRKDNLEVELTTSYDEVIVELASDESEKASIQELLSKYQVCVCRDNIVSISRFDFETYNNASLSS